jgi:hypothetical protein
MRQHVRIERSLFQDLVVSQVLIRQHGRVMGDLRLPLALGARDVSQALGIGRQAAQREQHNHDLCTPLSHASHRRQVATCLAIPTPAYILGYVAPAN